MAYERVWAEATQLFSANGTNQGIVTVSDVAGFYVKQAIVLQSNTQPNLSLEIKRIDGTTIIHVGPKTSNINDRTSVAAYLVADSASITAPEQIISFMKPDEIRNFVYERDPIKADRVLSVDKYGRPYDATNRVPVDATITVPPVEVAIDAFTKVPPDNLLAVGTEDGTKTGTKHVMRVDPDGRVEVTSIQIFTKPFDSITATYPSTTQEVYESRVGGIAGTIQETVTVNYTDTTKNLILNVARVP